MSIDRIVLEELGYDSIIADWEGFTGIDDQVIPYFKNDNEVRHVTLKPSGRNSSPMNHSNVVLNRQSTIHVKPGSQPPVRAPTGSLRAKFTSCRSFSYG